LANPPPKIRWALFVTVALLAFAVRLPQLGERPMHTDESVNAYLTGALLARESFHYDPQDRHGPALFVVAEPLVRLLGAEPVPVRAYNSNGLGLMGDRGVALEAEELVAEGFSTIKLRLGYDRVERDIVAVRAVRAAVGSDVEILVDYNQLLRPDEAHRRCAALDGLGLGWIEEPIVHDDFASYAALAAATMTPIQLGENFMGPFVVRDAIAAQACDLVMFDLQRIGGVSGWVDAARTTAAAGVPTSSHLFPEVSVHLLAATPTRDRLEFVDWASPILVAPLRVHEGVAVPPDVPGTGVSWDEAAVRRFLV